MKTVSSARSSQSRFSQSRLSKQSPKQSLKRVFKHSSQYSKFAPPLRLTPALCKTLAALACLWLSSTPRTARAADSALANNTATVSEGVSQGALMNLRAGKTLTLPLPADAKYSVQGADGLVKLEKQNGGLSVTALRAGRATLIIEIPDAQPQKYLLHISSEDGETNAIGESAIAGIPGSASIESTNTESTAVVSVAPGVAKTVGKTAGATSYAARTNLKELTASSRAALKDALKSAPFRLAALQITRPDSSSRKAELPNVQASEKTTEKTFSLNASLAQARATATEAAQRASVISESNHATIIERLTLVNRSGAQITILANAQIAPPLPELELMPRVGSKPTPTVPGGFPSLATPAVSPGKHGKPTATIKAVAASPTDMSSTGIAPLAGSGDSATSDVTTSSDVPPPRMPTGTSPFPMEAALPAEVERMASDPTAMRPLYRVSSGMARVMAFRANILAVFFSDENIMDARAINARTLAVTGKGSGKSTLAVFLSRYAGDVVGRAVIYNIEVFPASGRAAIAPAFSDPAAAEIAIRTAINDPRVRVSVIQRPDGTLVAQLAGSLRDKAEVDAAISTAALFVPNVIPSLYVDAKAPSLEEAMRIPVLMGEPLMQSQLRAIFGNDTIELIPLPGGTALKGVVNSAAEAEALLSILPSLGRQIQPFLVIRSAEGNRIYTSERPILYGEDFEITRRMNEVTGVSTVYAVRTARNALALYGTVRNRAEYETIRRYANILPQLQETAASTQQTTTQSSGGATLTAPAATTATTSSVAAVAPALSAVAGVAPAPSTAGLSGLTQANAPAGAYKFPIQVQMFVRVLDDSSASVRLVTVESTIAEISRNTMKNLGATFGSATLLSETTTAGSPGIQTTSPLGVTTTTGATPAVTTRTIDPTFRQGEGLLGDFAGFGSFSNLNPIRVRLNALLQSGAARVLSKPNLTAVEGAAAQITIGGVRPVPQVTSTGAAGGSQQTNIVFRRFGIILSMRPTVTDDDTIILQIRGDVTNLDPSIAINLGGAIIPGESVRSVDTTVTMREGDTLVLGGLITNEYRKQTSKVPILGDLPIIGALFRSKNFENNETELAIFLTPRMIRQRISPNGQNAVSMVPSFPPLPSLQDQQSNAFGLTSAGPTN